MDNTHFTNLTPHTISYIEGAEKKWTLAPESKALRLNYSRNKAEGSILLTRVDVVTTARNPLPPMIIGKLYIVSDEVRRTFNWRPDFVSPSKLKKTADEKVKGCSKFLGNPGYEGWINSDPRSAVVLIRPTIENAKIIDHFKDSTLVFNLMSINEQPLVGAINIPPGRDQEDLLTDVTQIR